MLQPNKMPTIHVTHVGVPEKEQRGAREVGKFINDVYAAAGIPIPQETEIIHFNTVLTTAEGVIKGALNDKGQIGLFGTFKSLSEDTEDTKGTLIHEGSHLFSPYSSEANLHKRFEDNPKLMATSQLGTVKIALQCIYSGMFINKIHENYYHMYKLGKIDLRTFLDETYANMIEVALRDPYSLSSINARQSLWMLKHDIGIEHQSLYDFAESELSEITGHKFQDFELLRAHDRLKKVRFAH